MLSYISKTVSKAYKASKKAVITQKQAYKQTEAYKRIRLLQKCTDTILPTTRLSQLAQMTYSLQQFQLILDILIIKIQGYKFDQASSKEQKQFRNTLIIIAYLIKNGASGFIDEFRQQIPTLKRFFNQNEYPLVFTYKNNEKMGKFIQENIMCRARYIVELLQDKQRLITEKRVSMLVKQKIKQNQMKNKNKTNNTQGSVANDENLKNQKIENFMENYLWKYMDFIDDKLDKVAQLIVSKIQKHLMEQIPESFQIDELAPEIKLQSETDTSQKNLEKQHKFVEERQKQLYKKQQVKKQQIDLLQL